MMMSSCQICHHRALYCFSRITDQRYEKIPYFVFGDFNFRLDSKQVIEVRVFVFCDKRLFI